MVKKQTVEVGEKSPVAPVKTTPTVSKPPIPPKEETVNIPRTFFEDLKVQIQELKRSNDMLLSVADKKAIALYFQRNQQDLPKEVKLRILGGKVIVGWRTTRDEVYQDPVTRVWREYQDVELVFEDGTTLSTSLMDFNRKYTYVVCKRTGIVTNEETGDQAFKLVRLDNGQEYTIGSQFIN